MDPALVPRRLFPGGVAPLTTLDPPQEYLDLREKGFQPPKSAGKKTASPKSGSPTKSAKGARKKKWNEWPKSGTLLLISISLKLSSSVAIPQNMFNRLQLFRRSYASGVENKRVCPVLQYTFASASLFWSFEIGILLTCSFSSKVLVITAAIIVTWYWT